MRIALISDVHANHVALEAVLAHLGRTPVDHLVCLGDVATLGPEPGRVLETLAARGARCVRGNHDTFLVEPETLAAYTSAPTIVDTIAWCRDRLSAAELAQIQAFPPHLALPLGDGTTLLACHGSPRSATDDLLATTPGEGVDAMLAGVETAVVACGHTHLQLLRQHRGRLLVNPGSVGLPFAEFTGGRTPTLLPHAEYAVVETAAGGVSVSLHRVPVDRAAQRAALAGFDAPLRGFLADAWR
jgi:putative phosphoesterase